MNKILLKALHNPFVTIAIFLMITVAGVAALFRTPMDALPDLSENQVIVMTMWPGQSPKNVEDQVTYPITVSLQGLAGVKDVRAMSQLGISMVTVIFRDDVGIYFARDRVSERLSLLRTQLPPGVEPVIGPDATGLGQVFMYTLESDSHTLTELRSIQDFTVRYALQSVPGVAEVASVGGHVKRYQIILDPVKLDQYGVKLMGIISKIKAANNTVSGKVLDTGDREMAIQAEGFFENPEQIGNTVIGTKSDGTPLIISDIGSVRESGAFRRGILADQNAEKVGGVVVMRYEKNPLEVIAAVKAKIAQIEEGLPTGVTVEPFYDRTGLIKAAINTLRDVLWQELLITAIVLGLFLWHFGSTIVTVLALIVGVIIAFLCMYIFKIPLNIMSLGGIAVAIGTMVDSAIVISENAYQKLADNPPKNSRERLKTIGEATTEVGKPIVFAIFIIILSFLPILTLEGMEGKLFRPLAYTNAFAMLGALIAALFLVPLLSFFFLRGKLHHEDQIPVMKRLRIWYKPLLLFALRCRKLLMAISSGILAVGVLLALSIGSEFMPPLNEGSIMYMPMTVPDVSEKRAQEILIATNKIIAKIPEVEKVVGKAGRADTATDPAPLAMLETFITLKPKDQWRPGVSKNDLIREMNRAIKIDQVWNGFTQPIIGRIDMLSTGIRAQVGIKFFGDDPIRLEELAIKAEELMGNIPGASGVATIRTTGLQYLNIELNDAMLAKHGIDKGEALELIAAGVGGKMISTTVEGRERYGIELRLKQGYREDTEDIRSLPLTGQGGSKVLLEQVADIEMIDGPAVINSENGMIRAAVQMNVMGRDLVGFVEEGKQYIADNLELPEGYLVEWSGQYENQLRAKQRLSIIVPTVLLLIFFFLYVTYKDFGIVSIVFLTIPFGLMGGIVALFLFDFNFSVAVWVGFISLFGNVVETGMVIMTYLENSYRQRFNLPLDDDSPEVAAQKVPLEITRQGIYDAVLEGSMLRLRPVLMTAFTSILGLMPMIIATGIGSEVQKPLAVVVTGGLITSVFLTLVVLPVLFAWLRERQVGKVPELAS